MVPELAEAPAETAAADASAPGGETTSNTLVGGDTASAADAPEVPATEAAPAAEAPVEDAPESKEAPAEKAEDAKPGPYDGLKLRPSSPLVDEDLDAIKTFAAEHALTPDAAQAMLDMRAEEVSAQAEARSALISGWEESIRSDPFVKEVGLEQSVQFAKTALAEFFDPEFLTDLDESGFGNEPRLFKGLVKLGQRMSEPTHIARGEGAVGKARPTWHTLFKNSGDPPGKNESMAATA